MGVVFRALDELAGTTVALKLLTTAHPQAIARARREAEVLARLSHRAIVQYVADGVTSDGRLYLVMEWIDGLTVADRIARDGFSLREALVVAWQVADALACAHEAGVLHRDVKPSNILLVGNDVNAVKVIDFGVAHVDNPGRSLTHTGAAIGTPGYMSPEQARGERTLTPASDVFGLGCVFYECATATPAFSGTAVVAVMAKILLAQPAPIASVCPEASRAVVELVTGMLAKSTNKRLLDCREVVAEIDRIGTFPDGPRRSSRRLTQDVTHIDPGDGTIHCVVTAARGNPDDIAEPPTTPEHDALAKAATAWEAELEILATGAVVAHLTGEAKETSHRAARVGLAMRRILPGWSITISSVNPEMGTAVEDGTKLLVAAAIQAIFGAETGDGIAVAASTAKLLRPEFDVTGHQGQYTLIRSLSD